MLTYKVYSEEFYPVGQGELVDSPYNYVVAIQTEGEPGHEVNEVWIARLTNAQYARVCELLELGSPLWLHVTEVVVGDFELAPDELYEGAFACSALDLDGVE